MFKSIENASKTDLQDKTKKTPFDTISSVGLAKPSNSVNQIETKAKDNISSYNKNRKLIKFGGKTPPAKETNIHQASTNIMSNSLNDINQPFVQDTRNQMMKPINNLTIIDASQAQTIQQNINSASNLAVQNNTLNQSNTNTFQTGTIIPMANINLQGNQNNQKKIITPINDSNPSFT